VRQTQQTFLFGDETIVSAIPGQSEFGHTFGGPPDRKGAFREDCQGIRLHLLHRLNLSDPKIPFSIPDIQWLPLYYCFDFRVNEMGYQLISDNEMVTYFHRNEPNTTNKEEWPDENYPLEFPSSTISLQRYDYDPTDLEDAYAWAGIFGIGNLSKRHQTILKKRVSKMAEMFGMVEPETDEEFDEALSLPFLQGKPSNLCINPNCSSHQQQGQSKTVAIVPSEPVPGVQTFGSLGMGVMVYFMMCSRCHTLRVSNQSG
jgi:hypothetical protein